MCGIEHALFFEKNTFRFAQLHTSYFRGNAQVMFLEFFFFFALKLQISRGMLRLGNCYEFQAILSYRMRLSQNKQTPQILLILKQVSAQAGEKRKPIINSAFVSNAISRHDMLEFSNSLKRTSHPLKHANVFSRAVSE